MRPFRPRPSRAIARVDQQPGRSRVSTDSGDCGLSPVQPKHSPRLHRNTAVSLERRGCVLPVATVPLFHRLPRQPISNPNHDRLGCSKWLLYLSRCVVGTSGIDRTVDANCVGRTADILQPYGCNLSRRVRPSKTYLQTGTYGQSPRVRSSHSPSPSPTCSPTVRGTYSSSRSKTLCRSRSPNLDVQAVDYVVSRSASFNAGTTS